MDSWLGSELRLAQRQGLLQGRHLSQIQFAAVLVLDWIDQLRQAKTDAEADLFRVKQALVSSGQWEPRELFADYFPAPKDEKVPESLDVTTKDGKLGVDYSEVEFKGSEAFAEYEALMQQVSQASSGTVHGGDLLADDERGWM